MAKELYRNCTLARSMQSRLDDMVRSGELPGELARAVMEQLDVSLCREMELRHDAASTNAIQARLRSYNNCEGVWRFDLADPLVVTETETLTAETLKVVCCPRGNTGGD